MAKTGELGGFRIIHKIGEGGMGIVYKARQKSLDRIVAVKVLSPRFGKDTKFVTRFEREAHNAAKLNHPNIVQIFDVGLDQGIHYLAMEFVDGPSIREMLKKGQVFEESKALRIVKQIARAVHYAQGAGLVHRDIKPDNILLASDGTAKLADLGLAKRMEEDSGLTMAGTTLGTPDYMSPEQARGDKNLDIRSDLYSLGVSLFHMVTGRLPFIGDAPAVVMLKHLNDSPPDAHVVNPKVSKECARLINKLLRKRREHRIQTPKELMAQIDRVLSGGSADSGGSDSSKRRRSDSQPLETKDDRGWVLRYGGVGAVVLLLIAVIVLVSGRSRREPERLRPAFELPERIEQPKEEPLPEEEAPDPFAEEAPPVEDGMTELKKMLQYVQEWEREHEDDYEELLLRYGKVKKAAEGTAAEFEIGDRVDVVMQNVMERQSAASEAAWKSIEMQVEVLVGSGDYDGAIGVLQRVPERFLNLLGDEAAAWAFALGDEADEKITSAVDRAKQLLVDGRPGDGLRTLSKVEKLKYAPAAEEIEEIKEQLSSARVNEVAIRKEKQKEDAEKLFQEMFERFSRALIDGDNTAVALAVVQEAEKNRALRSVRERMKSMREVLSAIEEVKKLERESIEKLLGGKVSLETKDGEQVEGVVSRIEADTIHVKVLFGGGSAVRPVKIENLAEEQKKRFRGDYTPQTDAQKIAAVIERMRKGDTDGAAQMIDAAAAFPLAVSCAKLLKKMQVGEAEVAAEEVWGAIEAFSQKYRKLTRERGTELLGILVEFEEQHFQTEYGTDVAEKLLGLREWATDAIVGFNIQKLFKGTVEEYDPETRAITVFYAFDSDEDLQDWRGNVSKFTGIEIRASNPKDPVANVQVKDGRVVRVKAPGEIGMQTAAAFENDISYTVVTGVQFGNGGGPGILYRSPADSPRFYCIRFRTEKLRDGKSVALAAHGMSYNIASETKPFKRGGDKSVKHTLILKGTELTYLIDDKRYISDWLPISDKWEFKAERPLMHPFVIVGTYGAQNLGIDEIRIEGTLRKEWLDEKVKEFKDSLGVNRE